MTTDLVNDTVRDLERLAVERYALTLRERVRRLPVNDEDGLWVRTEVERMLNEVTTPAGGPDGAGPRARLGNSDSPATAAAALKQRVVAPEQPGQVRL